MSGRGPGTRHDTAPEPPVDRLGRALADLRISVTDRCNFRCRYCMPREVFGERYGFVPRQELLSFDEITRLTGIFAELGVRKVRLTGGEPLLRARLAELVAMLSRIDGLDIALTTNGSLLAQQAQGLKDAGLQRVTVSLDSLDEDTFARMNDADFPVSRVLDGIAAAERAGLEPVKINAVIRRDINDDGVVDLARRFKGSGAIVRFIEYMDVGTSNGWRFDDVVPAAEIIQTISREMPLEPAEPAYRGEVARRWRYVDGSGEIGVISSVTQPFCGDCSRARLSADGVLYSCLFAAQGTDMRALLHAGASDDVIEAAIRGVWARRNDRYSELRSSEAIRLQRIEMSYIGG
jgi:cyclic pyranopterin phosphate synthase